MKDELNIELLRKIIFLDKKVLGFRFLSSSNCSFPSIMEDYVGKEAKIIGVHEVKNGSNCYNFQFEFKEDKESYCYPAEKVIELFFKNDIEYLKKETIILTKEELFNIISYATQKVNLNKEITLEEISELKMYDKNKLFLEELLKEIKK